MHTAVCGIFRWILNRIGEGSQEMWDFRSGAAKDVVILDVKHGCTNTGRGDLALSGVAQCLWSLSMEPASSPSDARNSEVAPTFFESSCIGIF